MLFKKKNYNSAEQTLKREQRIEYWEERYYHLDKCFSAMWEKYGILKKEYENRSIELDNTKKELDKYTMLYHDALSRLRQVMEATNYGKE